MRPAAANELPHLLRRLLERAGKGAILGLGPIRSALETLGNPQRGLRCIHIAGTNGKGSTCAMVEAMARAAGLRTGMYTSPHLCRFNERIRINGRCIDDEGLAAALRTALGAKLGRLTFFETMTVAALVALSDAEVDLAILEVGLGGRFDATNVIEEPLVTAITSIGYDHTAYLGNDLRAIGCEKAAIAKPGCPMVVGPVAPAVERVIERVSRRLGSGPLCFVRPAPTTPSQIGCGATRALAKPATARPAQVVVQLDKDGTVVLAGPKGQQLATRVGLRGLHQSYNASVAASIGWQLEEIWPQLGAHISHGLETATWSGRLQTFTCGSTTLVLDCAHNVPAAQALRSYLLEHTHPASNILVFGAMGDKPWSEMLDLLGPLTRERYYTEPLKEIAGRRPVPPETLAQQLPGAAIAEPRQALDRALACAEPSDCIVVTGSIFLVGAVWAALTNTEPDVSVPL